MYDSFSFSSPLARMSPGSLLSEMDEPFAILPGSAEKVLRDFRSNSFEALVTDPPYGLAPIDHRRTRDILAAWLAGKDYVPKARGGIEGHAWDACVPGPKVWEEILRVLKPGAYALVFSSARTLHLTMVALELAGFEIAQSMAWFFGRGFNRRFDIGPKVEKAVKKARGDASPLQVTGTVRVKKITGTDGFKEGRRRGQRYIDKPVYFLETEEGRDWSGWRTEVTPSHDPIIVARKPLAARNLTSNIIDFGVGGLNVAGCRDDEGRLAATVRYGQFPEAFRCDRARMSEGDAFLPPGVLNNHSCLKPIPVMALLSKLACHDGQTILDPFCGSGSGGIGALMTNRKFVGIERDPKMAAIAEARVRGWRRAVIEPLAQERGNDGHNEPLGFDAQAA
jgi:site-specific DNA-methyltransferase (adenine-specific)